MAVTSNQNRCPKCGGLIIFGGFQLFREGGCYAGACQDCDFAGEQTVTLSFDCWEDENGNELGEYKESEH